MKELFLDNFVPIVVGVSIALLGILIQKTRAYFLIAGYNTSSPLEKNKVNISKVAIALRSSLMLLGLVWILIPVISDIINVGQIRWLIVIVLHIAICIELVIRVNSNKKYTRDSSTN